MSTATATPPSVPTAPVVRAGVVDVHAHWLPRDLFDLPPGSPLPPLTDRDGELHLGDLPLTIPTAAMSDLDQVAADTDAAGLGSRVLSAPPFAFGVVDAPGAGDYADAFNAALVEACRDGGGRLLGLGLVDLHDPARAQRQLRELRRTGVVRGIAVPPLVGATTFDDGPLAEVVALAAAEDAAVLVHPMQLPRPEWGSYYLANLVGNPTETATAVAACVLGGVVERHPDLRICFVHGGGCAPGLLGRWRHGWEQRAEVRGSARPPHDGFRDLWFDTLTHDPAVLRLLAEQADRSRLMCGSDHPFDMGTPRPVDDPVAVGLDAALLEANARRFLGLDPTAPRKADHDD
ncbi:amidohydrolase family protein [Nocardioides sp. CPCC 205120]|uniref:amidohydrolase family protein n=1 Tax=Nocardioides sp. CPCC 205120 TaxID=3406462 RepID=UPI003B500FCD